MGTTSQKLTYLAGTKDKLKTTINYTGAGIDNNTTFREYDEKLYNALASSLIDNQTIFDNMPKVNGSGTDLTLNNTTESKMQLTYKGNTQQDSTTGKNTFHTTLTSGNQNGITYVVNDDGSIKFNGTASAITYIQIGTWNLTGNYILNGISGGSNSTYWLYLSGQLVNLADHTTSGDNSFTSDGGTYTLTLRIENGKSINETIYPMVRLSSVSDSSYEPYTGNQPSPNPDYPQTIHSVSGDNDIEVSNEDGTQSATYPINLGDIELNKIGDYQDSIFETSGKNLLPTDESAWEQGSFDVNTGVETSSTTRLRSKDYIPFKNDTYYYVSVQNTSYCFLNIFLYDNSKNYLGQYYESVDMNINGATSLKIRVLSSTLDDVAYARFVLRNANNTSTIIASEISKILPMINLGETAIQFEPYGNGDWYIKKEIGSVVLNGSETGWQQQKNLTNTMAFSLANCVYNSNVNNAIFKCNYFTHKTYISSYAVNLDEPYLSQFITTTVVLSINKSDLSSENVNGFKSWLSNHNTIVKYPLATPTYTKITDTTLLGQLNAIKKSYEGQTNISQVNDDLPFVLNVSAIKKYE